MGTQKTPATAMEQSVGGQYTCVQKTTVELPVGISTPPCVVSLSSGGQKVPMGCRGEGYTLANPQLQLLDDSKMDEREWCVHMTFHILAVKNYLFLKKRIPRDLSRC